MQFVTIHDTFNADSQNVNIFIECPRRGIFVESYIPSDMKFTTNSKWEPFFQALDSSGVISIVDSAVQVVSGYSIQNPILKRKVWKGSDPMTFDLPLIFFSMTDAKTKVFDPVQDLLNLPLPMQVNRDKLFYEVPGPLPLNGLQGSGLPVNIYIGQWLALKSVFIEGVSVNFSAISQNSYPTRADVTLKVGLQDASTSGNVFMQSPQDFNVDQLKGLTDHFDKKASGG